MNIFVVVNKNLFDISKYKLLITGPIPIPVNVKTWTIPIAIPPNCFGVKSHTILIAFVFSKASPKVTMRVVILIQKIGLIYIITLRLKKHLKSISIIKN